jgi:hypothetical protein
MLPVRIRHRLRPAVTRRIAQRCAKHTLSAFSADDRLANEPVQSAACQLRSLGGCGVEVHESLEVITHGVDHRAGHRQRAPRNIETAPSRTSRQSRCPSPRESFNTDLRRHHGQLGPDRRSVPGRLLRQRDLLNRTQRAPAVDRRHHLTADPRLRQLGFLRAGRRRRGTVHRSQRDVRCISYGPAPRVPRLRDSSCLVVVLEARNFDRIGRRNRSGTSSAACVRGRGVTRLGVERGGKRRDHRRTIDQVLDSQCRGAKLIHRTRSMEHIFELSWLPVTCLSPTVRRGEEHLADRYPDEHRRGSGPTAPTPLNGRGPRLRDPCLLRRGVDRVVFRPGRTLRGRVPHHGDPPRLRLPLEQPESPQTYPIEAQYARRARKSVTAP